jgi:preprotein translocase SecE subunit
VAASSEQIAASSSPLKIYKPNQGKVVRLCTAAGAGALALWAGDFIFNELVGVGVNDTVTIVITAVCLVVVAYGIYWVAGKNRTTVDFFIVTEGEMKKVNWSTKREIIGATKVVIITTLVLSALLFLVDLLCIFGFSLIDLLKGDLMSRMFGSGTPT